MGEITDAINEAVRTISARGGQPDVEHMGHAKWAGITAVATDLGVSFEEARLPWAARRIKAALIEREENLDEYEFVTDWRWDGFAIRQMMWARKKGRAMDLRMLRGEYDLNNRQKGKVLIFFLVFIAGALDFLANYLAAHTMLTFGTYLIPGGTFVFAFTFVIYDTIRRLYGRVPTIAAILLGFIASLLYALIFADGIGRIALAGLVALIFSGSADYLMQTITLRWSIWRYVLASNAISLLIDSIVFVEIAFSVLPSSVRQHIIEGQYGAKIAMTVLAIPLVYIARRQSVVQSAIA